jgi:L-lactate dehydrogenase (cytochrome)
MSGRPRGGDRKLEGLYTIEDLRLAAERRLPRAIFDTIDGAAGDEAAALRNLRDLASLALVPRVLVDVSTVDTTTSVLGKPVDFPILLAPTGFNGLYYPEGELSVSAAATGTIQVLSAFASVSLERIAGVSPGRRWFQLYPFRSRDVMRDLVRRVRESGYEALCVTVDVPVVGSRHRDLRSGIGVSGVSLPFLLAAALHPGWSFPFLLGYRPRFESLEPYLEERAHKWLPLKAPELNPAFSWPDVDWLIQEWAGPTVIKGILHPEDAERAMAMGASAIIVSNHGGRQFESAPSTLRVLPEIRERLGEECEIYVDGGVRTGSDVLKFLASGATACLSGRAYLYGLCIAGASGVSKALAILRRELEMAMRLAGITDLKRRTLARVRRVPA